MLSCYIKIDEEDVNINRFFTNSPIENDKIILTDDNVHHIKNVLKLNAKEKIICVLSEKQCICRIEEIEKNSITLCVESTLQNVCENDFKLTLFQGFAKGDKSDFIAEKATEAGAYEIVFVNTKRSVAKLSYDNLQKKEQRFSKIVKSASCQSGRDIIPDVQCSLDIKSCDFSKFDLKLLCYEDEKETSLKEVLQKNKLKKSIAIFIGPEGGMDAKEVEHLKGEGFVCVSLGKRILRCETAGIYAISCINYELND